MNFKDSNPSRYCAPIGRSNAADFSRAGRGMVALFPTPVAQSVLNHPSPKRVPYTYE
jgi:hypothetical protein